MASSGKAYTPPKGRATASRDGRGRVSRIPATVQWAMVAVLILGLVVAVWLFSDGSSGSPHGGLPAERPATLDTTSSAA